MSADPGRNALVQEARELLATMESALLQIEAEGASKEAINAIFRAAHTIKGSAGLFALDKIVGFTHLVESVLDKVRDASLALDERLISTLLGCSDYIGLLVTAIEQGQEQQDPDAPRGQALEAALRAALGAVEPPSPSSAPSLSASPSPSPAPQAELSQWHLSLRFHVDVLRDGLDPVAVLHYLGRLGQITALQTVHDAWPPAAQMDPESCYLGFEIDFSSAAEETAIASVFDFFREDGQIVMTALRAPPELANTFVSTVASTVTTDDAVLPAALKKTEDAPALEQRLIKIDVEKLDQLINLVGELVIAGAGASLIARYKKDPIFNEALQTIETLVGQIRDTSLSMRMVQINEVFQRFPRLVRDMSHTLDKKIELEISGAETELDKSMIEKIIDPLMHIVRNALDHGIESAAQRAQAGKPPVGTLRLNASHESGNIVIDVSDDGGGLDATKILNKAVAVGLVRADQSLSEQEIFQLIFEPGLSTADQVTALSGRGVGMDVVRKNIEALHGAVQVRSSAGQGTVVSIRMPLTMAIITGFQVLVGDAVFVIPLNMVAECLDISDYEINQSMITLRGAPLSLVSLASVFDMPLQLTRRKNLVVVEYGDQRAGILVDGLLGECQAVIKPLGRLFNQVKGLGGSTILGDGRVALILDVPHLIYYTQLTERRQTARAEVVAV